MLNTARSLSVYVCVCVCVCVYACVCGCVCKEGLICYSPQPVGAVKRAYALQEQEVDH